MSRIAIVLLLLIAALPAAAQEIYRWRDANGEEHFGSSPPPGVRAELWEPDQKPRVIIRQSERPKSRVHQYEPPASHSGRPNPYATGPDPYGTRPDPGARLPNPHATRPRVPAAAEAEPSEIDGLRESQWRSRGLAFERKVERLEDKIDDARWASAPSHYSSFSRARWDQRQEERIARMEEQIEQLEDELEELEDRARRAGVPPGWLR